MELHKIELHGTGGTGMMSLARFSLTFPRTIYASDVSRCLAVFDLSLAFLVGLRPPTYSPSTLAVVSAVVLDVLRVRRRCCRCGQSDTLHLRNRCTVRVCAALREISWLS